MSDLKPNCAMVDNRGLEVFVELKPGAAAHAELVELGNYRHAHLVVTYIPNVTTVAEMKKLIVSARMRPHPYAGERPPW